MLSSHFAELEENKSGRTIYPASFMVNALIPNTFGVTDEGGVRKNSKNLLSCIASVAFDCVSLKV